MPAPFDKCDRFIGAMLGLAVGDAECAPYEGMPADVVHRQFGPVATILTQQSNDTLFYTDDTQMAIAIAECLLQNGSIEQDALAACFLQNYEPDRGYGPGVRRLLDLMVAGGDWKALARDQFPGGSFGNGAAMRVAPIGLMFHADPHRLVREARESSIVTHQHELAIDSAIIVATGIAHLVRTGEYEHDRFYDELRSAAQTDEFRWQLRTASRLEPDDSVMFGSTLAAHRSVTTAITCFTFSPHSYSGVISRALSMGGDVDTVAAIAGALSGAALGGGGIPSHLLTKLENTRKGRDYLVEIASQLYARSEQG